MTKAQREEKARNERKLQQMIAAGLQIGPSDEAEGQEKKKKAADTRKRGPRKNENKVCIFRRVSFRLLQTDGVSLPG